MILQIGLSDPSLQLELGTVRDLPSQLSARRLRGSNKLAELCYLLPMATPFLVILLPLLLLAVILDNPADQLPNLTSHVEGTDASL